MVRLSIVTVIREELRLWDRAAGGRVDVLSLRFLLASASSGCED